MPPMKTKRAKKTKEFTPTPPKPPVPSIPRDILMEFLEEKIQISNVKDIAKINDGFAYEKNGIERYRIDVWIGKTVPNKFCREFNIEYSFWVHYDQAKITDKTLGQTKKDDENKIKKLEGIADSNVRVGKSPW